jgi:Putative peptidoglycan binding domain
MKKTFLKLLPFAPVVIASLAVAAIASPAFAAATVESVKLTAPNVITIIYSEPVYTSPSDYSGFTGSFAGNSVTSVSGSGTNTVTLTLAESEPSGASGYIAIGTNVQDVTDQQYFQGSTWNVMSSIGPAITSFGVSSNEENGSFSGTNDAITVNFDTNEQVTVLNMAIAGHSVSVGGGGTGPYTASYTMESGDPQASVPIVFTIEDSENNQTTISLNYSGNGTAVGTTGSTGSSEISSITSNANTSGVLTAGNSITFTLTPTTQEPNARIAGSYNGVPLSWATTNDGVNYVATYVVSNTDPNQPNPLQISGVTLTDQNGNVSAPASGYDVQKTISTSGSSVGAVGAATISQVTPVPSTVTTATPEYTFYTSEPGTIIYGGGCSSPTTSAVAGTNTVTFNALGNGTYSACAIAIVNTSGVQSGELSISPFTVSATGNTTASNTDSSSLSAEIASLESQLTSLQTQAGDTTTTATTGSDASTGFDFTEFLSVGSEDAQVTALQERLTADGFFSGPITGYYGALTQAAVEKFQGAHDISIFGYVGPATRAALNAGE